MLIPLGGQYFWGWYLWDCSGWAFQSFQTEAPSGIQNFVEMCIEFVNDNVQSIFSSAKNNLIGPMALTVLVWVFLMNLMDLVPAGLSTNTCWPSCRGYWHG